MGEGVRSDGVRGNTDAGSRFKPKPGSPPSMDERRASAGASSQANRGHCGGFRFGGFGNETSGPKSSQSAPAGGTAACIEGSTNLQAEVTAALVAAKACGPTAVRKTLKR